MKQRFIPLYIPYTKISIAGLSGFASMNFKLRREGYKSSKAITQSCLGNIAIYAIYQTLLVGFKTELLRKKGLITKSDQATILIQTIKESLKDGATISLSIGLLIFICPWLYLPFSILGLVGIGTTSVDLFNVFWDGLDEKNKAELLEISKEAGVNLRLLLNGGNNYLRNMYAN